MRWPWNKNADLIQSLYEELNEVKRHVQGLEKQDEFTKVLKQLRADVAADVVKEIDTTKLSESIAKVVLEQLRKSKVGLV